MKKILRCHHCLAEHQISESKVAGKSGKFRCIRCKALTPFSFPAGEIAPPSTSNYSPSKAPLSLYDLNFEQSVPTHPLRAQFHNAFFQNIKAYWFDHRLLFLKSDEGDIFDPKTFVAISGLSDPNKLRGLQFDVRPSDVANPKREVNVSNQYTANSGYRLSLFVEDYDARAVRGKLYLAIPDSEKTYLYGSFEAAKILTVKFGADGTSEAKFPDFISNYLTAKVLLLSGNIATVQDSFNRLKLDEKIKLFCLIVELWKVDSPDSAREIKFFEENVQFEISVNEKRFNEALVFLIANQVQVDDYFWMLLKKKISKSIDKDESYIQILKKRYPKEINQILDEIANRMVIPKDPSSIISRDDAESLKALMESGYSANLIKESDDSNPLRFSLLQEAVSGETSKCALLLLEYGADPNYTDTISETALFKLCQNSLMHLQDKVLLLDVLLQKGIHVNHQSQNKMTALHWCALFGEPSLAKRLIQAGINLELPDISKNTALHEACKFGHSSVLALLLEAGGKANAVNDLGQTGRDLAFEGLELAQLEFDTENQERFERILSLLDVYGG